MNGIKFKWEAEESWEATTRGSHGLANFQFTARLQRQSSVLRTIWGTHLHLSNANIINPESFHENGLLLSYPF